MEQCAVNVLLIGENEQGWWHLAKRLGHLGCRAWFASTTEEVRSLMAQHPFRLILSTRPVTKWNPLMQMVESECNVFYSIPVEHSCLWFQAAPDAAPSRRVSGLRPGEFMRFLNNLLGGLSTPRSPDLEPERLRLS